MYQDRQKTREPVPLSKHHFVSFLQSPELPTDEGIIVRVGVGGDKASPPVNLELHTGLL